MPPRYQLFFPLLFSHSRSPAYVRTALIVHVTMQIFVVVVVVVFVVSCNWFFLANHKSVSVLFLFTCILYCIAFLLLREALLRMRMYLVNYLLDLQVRHICRPVCQSSGAKDARTH